MNDISDIARNAVSGAEILFMDHQTLPETRGSEGEIIRGAPSFSFGINICDFSDYDAGDQQAIIQRVIDYLNENGISEVSVSSVDSNHSMRVYIMENNLDTTNPEHWNQMIANVQATFPDNQTSVIGLDEFFGQSHEPDCPASFVQADMTFNHS